jgi:hypothetical protein
VHLLENSQKYVSHLESAASDWSLFEKARRACFFSQELAVVSKIFIVLLVVNLLTCVPFYVLKFTEYGTAETNFTTHSYQYRWAGSAAYAKGNIPAIMLMLMWASVICAVVLLMMKDGPFRSVKGLSIRHELHRAYTREERVVSSSIKSKEDSKLTYAAIFFINATVNGVVNGMYVYLTTQALSPTTQLCIQGALALFKVSWNMLVVPQLAKPMKTSTRIVNIELIFFVFNNILIPSIVTGLTSPACFQVLSVLYWAPLNNLTKLGFT